MQVVVHNGVQFHQPAPCRVGAMRADRCSRVDRQAYLIEREGGGDMGRGVMFWAVKNRRDKLN